MTVIHEFWGLSVLFVVFVAPALCYMLARYLRRKLQNQHSELFLAHLRKNHITIVILYFFSTSAFTAIVSAVYVEHTKGPEEVSTYVALFQALEHSGEIFAVMLIPVLLISFLMDKVIARAGEYRRYLGGGYEDPVTGDENVSLRLSTFLKMIENCPKEAANDIGKQFAARIAKNASRSAEFSPERLMKFCDKWVGADEKAGWCKGIAFDSINDILSMKDSFAFRSNRDNDRFEPTVHCGFLESYVDGIVSSLSDGSRTAKLINCDKCSASRMTCTFSISKTGSSAASSLGASNS